MADLSADEIELRAMNEAYDALKCLDPVSCNRALEWLCTRFADEQQQGKKAREEAVKARIRPVTPPNGSERS